MSDLVRRLRELEKAAAPGPWRVSRSSYGYPLQIDGRAFNVHKEDADLIAEMRNALPLLLDVVEAAHGVIEAPYEVLGYYRDRAIRGLTYALSRLDSKDPGK